MSAKCKCYYQFEGVIEDADGITWEVRKCHKCGTVYHARSFLEMVPPKPNEFIGKKKK